MPVPVIDTLPVARLEPQEIVPTCVPLPFTTASVLVEEPLDFAVTLSVVVPSTSIDTARYDVLPLPPSARQ